MIYYHDRAHALPKPYRDPAGNPRPADSANAGSRRAAWARNFAGDPRTFRRRPLGGDRIVVSGVASAGEKRLARFGVENFGEQPAREVLLADQGRQETTGGRAGEMAGVGPGSFRSARPGVRGFHGYECPTVRLPSVFQKAAVRERAERRANVAHRDGDTSTCARRRIA